MRKGVKQKNTCSEERLLHCGGFQSKAGKVRYLRYRLVHGDDLCTLERRRRGILRIVTIITICVRGLVRSEGTCTVGYRLGKVSTCSEGNAGPGSSAIRGMQEVPTCHMTYLERLLYSFLGVQMPSWASFPDGRASNEKVINVYL